MGNQGEVCKNFGQRAANYRLSTTHGNPVHLERMIKLLNPGPEAIALDVATGGGHTAVALARFVQRVVAFDITEEMLAEAAINAKQSGIDNMEFLKGDVHDMHFPDDYFDIVASRLAPHHFFDIKKALQEMCRVLKPGGKLYIYDCSVFDNEEAKREMNRIELVRDSSHQCSYSPHQWKELLRELPLETLHLELHEDQYIIPQWFDRMETPIEIQQMIFEILHSLSPECKALYPYGDDFITTYKFELLAIKK